MNPVHGSFRSPRAMTGRIARGLLVALAVVFTLGNECDPKEEDFFDFIGDEPLPGTGDLFGTVTVDGSPRQGVLVTLRQGQAVIATDVTDQSGRYGFLNANPGSYTISIASPSGTTCTPSDKPATVVADEEVFVDFGCTTLPATGDITGTVAALE